MMDTSFWNSFATPILGLSPMDGVTDQPFRFIQKKYGQPDLMYTEFTSVEGLCHGADRLLQDFLYDETQRPIVAQIYGTTPSFFRQAAVILCQLGFDGIDINMGCPAKNVAHSGAGAALIKTPQLAQEIVRQTKAGVVDWLNGKTADDCPDIVPRISQAVSQRQRLLPPEIQARRYPLPVSVKTRLGYDQVVATDWMQQLLETEPAAIALHGRTLSQHYGGRADWDSIGAAAEVVAATNTIFLGNGDIESYETAISKIRDYHLNGVLIGRGSFGNPFVFQQTGSPEQQSQRHAQRLRLALEHAQLFEATYQSTSNYSFLPMRKHLGWYVRGVEMAKQMRIKLFQTNSADEVNNVMLDFNMDFQ